MLVTSASPSFGIMYRSTQVREKNGSFGTSFSALHATTQRAQPMHLSTDAPNPHSFPAGSSFACPHAGRIRKNPPRTPPDRAREERSFLRNDRRSIIPPPAGGDNGIASRRISPRGLPDRPVGPPCRP